MKDVDIIVPVYNEESTLEDIIKKIEETDYCGLKKQIIFVDDCSTDNSREILSKYTQYKILYHDKNYGKGAAVWTGMQNSTADILLIQDADLEYEPADYQTILPYIINGESEVVYGSRFKKEESKKSFLFLSFIANKFLTTLTNILFNCKITDMETCYKAFRRESIKDIEIKSKKFEFEVEITAKISKKGIKIKEVPISYKGREYASGKKVSAIDAVHAIFALIYYRFFN